MSRLFRIRLFFFKNDNWRVYGVLMAASFDKFFSRKGGNSSSTVYFQREENCVFTFSRWLPVLESNHSLKREKFQTGNQTKQINNWIRTIIYLLNTTFLFLYEWKYHKYPGVFICKTKSSVRVLFTITSDVGVPRTRVRRTKYRLWGYQSPQPVS